MTADGPLPENACWDAERALRLMEEACTLLRPHVEAGSVDEALLRRTVWRVADACGLLAVWAPTHTGGADRPTGMGFWLRPLPGQTRAPVD